MTATPGTPNGRPGAGPDGEQDAARGDTGLDDTGLDEAIAVLARRARERNRGRARRLTELLASPAALTPAAREEAMRLCHTVVGSAATFGAEGLSEAAGRLGAALGAGRDADVPAALDDVRAEAGTG
ncbi:Hpt domain-containing protein [Isoptericola sp. NPDC019693]|uniref:Hpt domain-containing protein n=1 Tax=Isoptericola sp. NPDC019693 TaxID=3364009 RepID=UPI0037A0146E